MSVRKTSVEINEELLAAVQRVLSTVSIKETIEQAFHEVLRVEARREEIEALSAVAIECPPPISSSQRPPKLPA